MTGVKTLPHVSQEVATRTRVVVAHADAFVRDVLAHVITTSGMELVSATSSPAALPEDCATTRPDVVICDPAGADAAKARIIEQLARAGVKILVIADNPSPENMADMLARGVSAYVLADTSPDQLAVALESVARGDVVLHPVVARTVLEQWRRMRAASDPATAAMAPSATLTPREMDVLRAMADGLSTKSIARRLGIAVKTVENHKIHVFDKLGVRSQSHAVSLAIGHALLPPAPYTTPTVIDLTIDESGLEART